MAGGSGEASSTRIDLAKIAIVEARYYNHINDPMIEGAKRRLESAGASVEHISVPGALEIPAAIRLCLDHASFEGFVAIGCVIRGETTHYDLVANESSRGLADLALSRGALIGNAILTVENEAQAIVRADPDDQDKGGHAAEAVIQLIALKRRLLGKA